jgi:hypothetical protein
MNKINNGQVQTSTYPLKILQNFLKALLRSARSTFRKKKTMILTLNARVGLVLHIL